MKVKIIFVSLVVLMLSSCNQTNSSTQVKAVKQEPKAIVNPNAKTSFEVKGMVCKMACGGSIRKSLMHSGAVARVEINFVEEAKTQEVIVHYDSSKMNATQLKALIEKTNDGQFAVISEASGAISK
ncbi:MAG: heavy-metal-associated domain-containing protein [Flavobacteriales bacterium]